MDVHCTCKFRYGIFSCECRCVAEQQRTLALGLQSVVWRTFGSIPGPVIFGVMFDSACIFWQEECGRRGNCWVYENKHVSERAVSIAIVGIFMNFVFSFLCWIVYPRKNAMVEQSNKNSEKVVDSSESASLELDEIGVKACNSGGMKNQTSATTLLTSMEMNEGSNTRTSTLKREETDLGE